MSGGEDGGHRPVLREDAGVIHVAEHREIIALSLERREQGRKLVSATIRLWKERPRGHPRPDANAHQSHGHLRLRRSRKRFKCRQRHANARGPSLHPPRQVIQGPGSLAESRILFQNAIVVHTEPPLGLAANEDAARGRALRRGHITGRHQRAARGEECSNRLPGVGSCGGAPALFDTDEFR